VLLVHPLKNAGPQLSWGAIGFALVQSYEHGRRQTSDWLNTGWLITASSA
jgi:hypothetical protein